ncbi:MAG: YbhB/YbcL family Raf kinase inhibitor-like protein [Alphaproteobacteria bacterium]
MDVVPISLAAIVLTTLGAGGSAADAQEFAVSSTSIAEGGTFDKKYTCRGKDVSIALEWRNPPPGTQAFALILDDPDARSVVGHTFVHWNVFNIPATTTTVAEGKDVTGGTVASNDFRRKRYNGPCPPSRHRYFTAVYALNERLDSPEGPMTREEFEQKYGAGILAKAEISALFP